MSRAVTARMNALRVNAQAIPVPMPTVSDFAASQVAWVTELRKSSGVQTQSMPAASAVLACSARSSAVSPIAAMEMRSSADTAGTLFGRGRLDRRVVEGAPEVEAGRGRGGPPLVGDALEFLRPGQLLHPVGDLDSPPDAEIADRDHVGPGQVEDQEHLGRPASDALHLEQLGDDVLVG